MANIALPVLDDHFIEIWRKVGATSSVRQAHRRKGLPTCRFVRYADDFVLLVAGTEAVAYDLRDQAAVTLASVGLRLSETKTSITHISRGFDFLGFRIQKRRKPGTVDTRIYTWPKKEALARLKSTVRAVPKNRSAEAVEEPLAPTQSGTAGVGQLLSVRSVEGHFQLRTGLHLAPCSTLAVPEASPTELEEAETPLPARMVADRGRDRSLQRRRGSLLRGLRLPNEILRSHGTLWRAGCVVTRMSGSEGGPEKPMPCKQHRRSGPTLLC